MSAVSFAIDHSFNKKAKYKYAEKPFFYDFDSTEVSQENADDEELKKMLLAEQQWQSVYAQKGLPPTLIK